MSNRISAKLTKLIIILLVPSSLLSVALALPPVVDNTSSPCFPPIRSQSNSNACSAFASNYYVMTYMTSRIMGWNQTLDTSSACDSIRFSPKWTYNFMSGTNGFGDPASAAAIMRLSGAATWSDFPFDFNLSNPLTYRGWPMDSGIYFNAIKHRLYRSGGLFIYSPTGLMQLKQLLNAGAVVSFSSSTVGNWHFKRVSDDPTTTVDDDWVGDSIADYLPQRTAGHFMCIAGYNDHIWVDINGNNRPDPGEKGAFKIADSQGPLRGNKGCWWVSYDAFLNTSDVKGWTPASRQNISTESYAYYLLPRYHYHPLLLARATFSHPKRANFQAMLGSSPMALLPTRTFNPGIFSFQGSGYAFDGTSVETPITVYFDFTDLAVQNSDMRYHFKIRSNSPDTARLLKFDLVDPQNNITAPCLDAVRSVANDSAWVYIDYRQNSSNTPPVISSISDITIYKNTISDTIRFTVSDAESPAAELFATGYNLWDAVVQPWGLVFGGSGVNRTLVVHPLYNSAANNSTIYIECFDPNGGKAVRSFKITVRDTVRTDTIPLVQNVPDTNRYGHNYFNYVETAVSANFSFQYTGGPLWLRVVGWDVDSADEVSVFMDGVKLGVLSPAPDGTHNNGDYIAIPQGTATGRHVLRFQNKSAAYQWGITRIMLSPDGSTLSDQSGHAMTLSEFNVNPNPFNPVTAIRFHVPADQAGKAISLRIYDMRGKLVRVLADGPAKSGLQTLLWDGRNGLNLPVASGTYIYRLKTAQGTMEKRMVMVK